MKLTRPMVKTASSFRGRMQVMQKHSRFSPLRPLPEGSAAMFFPDVYLLLTKKLIIFRRRAAFL